MSDKQQLMQQIYYVFNALLDEGYIQATFLNKMDIATAKTNTKNA